MTEVEAKALILGHAGFTNVADKQSFTGRLRPYVGLSEDNFAELVQCLITLHSSVVASTLVDRDLCAALWWICEHTRILALRPGSSLRRNKLLADRDLEKLEEWIKIVEYFCTKMLRGLPLEQCAYQFIAYLGKALVDDKRRYGFALPLIDQARHSDDTDVVEAARQAASVLRGQ